ncbi:MAG: hypothetical protein HY901_03495 [Deltaproteobacteria bacterium]|nr:hypothetical protein [Deltaproteobacteria bacterium]
MIERVGLDARKIGNPLFQDLSLHVSAWGRVTPAQAPTRLGTAADLDLAFLSGQLFDRRLSLKLGRHVVFGGVARARQIDGASFGLRIVQGFGMSAYGGLPVFPRFAVGRGDAVVGGRLYYRASIDAEIGASVLQLWDGGATAQQLAGMDLRLVIRSLTLGASGAWSLIDSRLAEADVAATWQAVDSLQASIGVRRTAPDLFLSRTSILSVFASETRDGLGGSLSWQPAPNLSLLGEYHCLRFGAQSGSEGADLPSEGGNEALVRASVLALQGLTVGVQGRWLDTPSNGYVEGRIFSQWRILARLSTALDLDAFRFRDPINGHRNSYVASLSATWTFAPSWMATVSGLASVTPYFETRFEGVAKLVYRFSTRTREVLP